MGVFIAANGSQKRQKEVLLGKSTTWSIKVSTSNLTQEEKLTSYRQQLLPSLRYPLPCTTLTRKELRSVHYPALRVAVNALGLNSTFPRCILYGNACYQGLDMEDLYMVQGTEKIKHYLGHLRTQSETGRLLRIQKDHVELHSGQGKCPLRHPALNKDSWMERTWIGSLGEFLDYADGYIETEGERLIDEQRENNKFLMERATTMSKTAQELIQQCRLFL